MNAVYDRANDHRWVAESFVLERGRFERQLRLPPQARGPCHVRVYVEGEADFAVGAKDVYARRPPQEK